MRAARFHAYGGVETLVVEQAPDPHPGPAEIRVRVAAAGVNPIDWKLRSGALQQFLPLELPAIPGRDAAGAGLASVTAMRGLNALGPLAGRTLLVEGAAGGVGSAAVEIAVARGATVIGTAGERNHEFLSSLGAVPTTYGPGLARRVTTLAPQGIDIVPDTAASGSLADLVAIAGDAKRVATVADHVGGRRLGTHVVAERTHPRQARDLRLNRPGRPHGSFM